MKTTKTPLFPGMKAKLVGWPHSVADSLVLVIAYLPKKGFQEAYVLDDGVLRWVHKELLQPLP